MKYITIDSCGLWQYSLSVYPSIKAIALALQDSHDLNVNVLLLAGYTQSLGCAIDESDIQRLVDTTQHWQQQLTQPFRALRRELKSSINAEQYQKVLSLELALEQEEQWRLVSALQPIPPANIEAQANILSCLIAFKIPLEALSDDALATLFSIGQPQDC